METQSFFEISEPDSDPMPVVFNSPHSGCNYSQEFVASSRLSGTALRRSEDFLVDQLFDHVTRQGALLVKALFPRAWLDVNREPYELDPAMFDGPLPDHANTYSARVNSGLGTIARVVAENEEIYSAPLMVEEGLARIETIYQPYHRALRECLSRTLTLHGFGILIDCHSMPSHHGSSRFGTFGTSRPTAIKADFVLGDRYGNSCSSFLTHTAAHLLRGFGYRVAINKPYAGGFITQNYGRQTIGLHALQIEINRALYMDEYAIEPSEGFSPLNEDLQHFTQALLEIVCNEARGEFIPVTLAAE